MKAKLYYVKKRKGAEIVALPAHYCPVCNKYMMGELSFSLFGECFGNFSVQTIKGPDCKHDYSDFEGESELYRLGYSARAGKSDYERYRVLVDILESEKLSFSEIVATIEADIRRYQFHPNFVAAIPKYHNDLEFINNYAKQKLRAANAEQKE